MSAIAGILRLDGTAAARADIEPLLAALRHRGDVRRVLVDGPVALAALGDHDPAAVTGAARRAAVTCHARVDNREQLRVALSHRSGSDAELVLAAFRRWGDEFPQQLVGDFAVAAWDPLARTLFCARDHHGVRQLYHVSQPEFFAFATEPKALLALPGVRDDLDEVAIADHLYNHFPDPRRTLFREIRALSPAHGMVVAASGPEPEKRYWSLADAPEIRLDSDAEYADAYLATLSEAVRCRVAVGRAGGALSGGLASSSIACLAASLAGPAPFPVVSAIYPTVAAADERRHIDAVLEYARFKPMRVEPWAGPLEAWPLDEWRRDQPLASPALPLVRAIGRISAVAGVEILLDGDGGYPVRPLARRRRASVVRRAGTGRLARALRAVRSPPAPVAGLPVRLNPAFAARLAAAAPPDDAAEGAEVVFRGGPDAHDLALLDRAGAHLGLQFQHPLMDLRLTELMVGLPPEQLFRAGNDRVVAREAMQGILPEVVRGRLDRADHDAVFDTSLEATDGELLRSIIFGASPVWDYVDRAAARQAFARLQLRRTHRDAMVLWSIASMATWLSMRADRGTSPG